MANKHGGIEATKQSKSIVRTPIPPSFWRLHGRLARMLLGSKIDASNSGWTDSWSKKGRAVAEVVVQTQIDHPVVVWSGFREYQSLGSRASLWLQGMEMVWE
jgi:hypothetical protein